jgi:sugar lactone lactonase YvrE
MDNIMRKTSISRTNVLWLAVATMAITCGPAETRVSAQAVQFVPTLTSVVGGGTGTCGTSTDALGDGCSGSVAKLSGVRAMVVDPQGNLVFADVGDNLVRRWNSQTGVVTVIAGGATTVCSGASDAVGDGCLGPQSQLGGARGVAVDTAGNVYIADNGNNTIREVSAQTGIISIVAGGGTVCSGKSDTVGDGCPATQSTLSGPTSVAVGTSGNIYISDYNNSVVREVVAATGIINIVAGKLASKCASAAVCGDGGAATAATLYEIYSIVVDAYGNIFIVDHGDFRIRLVTASTGIISTIAGTTGSTSTVVSSGNGGPALAANIQNGYNIAVDASENVYFDDSGVGQVREVVATSGGPSPVYGNIILIAGGAAGGGGTYAGDGGPAVVTGTAGELNTTYGVAIDNQGNLYLSDEGQGRILRASYNNAFAGTAVASSTTQSLLAQTIAPDTLNSTTTSSLGEFAAVMQTDCATGMSVVAGTNCGISTTFTPKYAGLRRSPLLLSDSAATNPVIGLIGVGLAPSIVFTPGTISTAAGTGVAGYSGDTAAATAAKLSSPSMSAYDAGGDYYIADTGNSVVRRVDAVSGYITTVAGTGAPGYSGDGSLATSAKLSVPQGVAVDAAGNIYIADTGNNAIREIAVATGKISTIAGTGTAGYSGDNTGATGSTLRAPAGVAVDTAGNVYIADTGNNVVREIFSESGFIQTIAGNSAGTAGSSGSGGQGISALLSSPTGLFWQPNGTLTISNAGSSTVSQLNLYSDIITTVAGNGTAGFAGDTGLATAAELQKPAGVALDGAGDVYIADTGNARVRRVDASTGIISTVAGDSTAGDTGDSGSATAASLNAPSGIALDATFNPLITDAKANVVRRDNISKGATLVFASQATYTTSATQVLDLTNAGNQPLAFSAISVAANFQQEAYSSSDCASTTVLAAGATCTIGIAFVPQSAGTINGSVVTSNNNLLASGSMQTTLLSGTSVLTANKLSLTGLNATTVAGSSQSLTVTALANSTVVATYIGTVTFTSTDPAAVLPASYTFKTSDNGVHVFTGVILKTVGTQSITATDSADSLSASESTNVTAGTAASITATAGGGQTAKVSTAFTLPFKAQVKDAYGNVVSGASVSFSAPGTGVSGTFTGGSASDAVTTDATGTATAPTFTANSTTGTYNVSASVSGVTTTAAFSLTNVANQYTTATTLAVTPTGAQTYGQSLLLTATVAPFTDAGITATGTIYFYDSGVGIGSVVLTSSSGGVVSMTVSLPAVSTHSYTATYSGDNNFAGSASTASVVVIGKATATLSGAAVSLNYGQSGTAPVTVSGQHAGTGVALPTGTVTYQIGTMAPGTTSLVSGVASIPIPGTLATGTYTMNVTYNGDSNYASGGSTNISITINKLTSTTTVTSSLNPASLNSSITLAATVKPAATSSGVPTGSVIFYDGSTALTATAISLNTSGTASYTTSTLAAGSHNITAVYSGDANFNTSTSPTLVQVVAAPGVTLSASPTSFTVIQGSYGSTTLTLTPVGGIVDTVALSCTGLPAYSSCVFNIPIASASKTVINGVILSANSTPISVGFSVATRGISGQLGELKRPVQGERGTNTYLAIIGWPCLLLLGIACTRRRFDVRGRLLMLVVLSLIGAGCISGCGNGSQTGTGPTPIGSYSMIVTATGTATGITQSLPVSVNVIGQ